ncbi:hypothetical protein NLX67_17200 [Domibacillus sp. A3M-37]|uniref:hypothetical protein n=1 Tax=Domibacillus sp. A3M-37 TaxID=2962037 RepID=UPI0020B6EBC3|nr:hypothetical protein [Domibacillus sp. A3M-37]MCP3764090.1 hypothetical protein [Domibacillus sp. A3M-37]
MSSYKEVLETLCKKMTKESRALLFTVREKPMNKKQIWEVANLDYLKLQQERSVPEPKKLITSRYCLDLNMARLEGAILVNVRHLGVVAVYNITELGKEVLSYFFQLNRTKIQN